MSQIAVTIIIPVFNGAAFIREALDSIFSQTHSVSEVIVIDDGSTDQTREIAKVYQSNIQYHYQENSGAPSARNMGITHATGDVIGFLDADDTYQPNKLEIQIARLDRYPSIDIVMGSRKHYRLCSNKNKTAAYEQVTLEDHVPLQLGCGLFRKHVFERIGLFDTSLKYCDDYDWFNRAREQSQSILLHDDVVLHQRIHTGNITRKRDLANRYQLMAFKKSLDRRRRDPSIPAELPALSNYHENFIREFNEAAHE